MGIEAIVVVMAVVELLFAFVVLIILVSDLFTVVERVFGIQTDAREITKKCEHKGTEEEVA